jgi:hypothetical protein
MEEAGWIERRPDPADRRARRLFLTDKAHPVLDRIWDVATKTQNEALLHLSQEEANRLIGLLHKVHGTLAARLPIPRADPDEPESPRPPRRAPVHRREPALVEGGR